MSSPLVPKIVSTFQEGYPLKALKADLLAGILVGILSIPMAIAFAIASGARPEQGIVTACVAGTAAALTTGCRYQITGPTGAFVILIAAIIGNCGYPCLIFSTLLAGLLLLITGFTRLGFVIKFIPYPVTIGFTSGIALLIFTSQIPDFLGLSLAEPFPVEFVGKWIAIVTHLKTTHLYALAIGALSLGTIVLWKKLNTSFPGALVAIIVSIGISSLFELPVETINDRFGTISFSLSLYPFSLPTLQEIPNIVSSAIAITLLAGIESLLSAVVADGMSGRKHNSNMELISQGFANLASALFGGLPATGAIARTATNIKTGGFSPVAALINAITVGLLLTYFDTFVSRIPFACLAAILFFIAYNMSEWRHFIKLFKSPPSDIAVLLTTFLLTVFVDLVTGIEVGIILAGFIFIHKMEESARFLDLVRAREYEEKEEDYTFLKELKIPSEIQVFEIQGPLFFAAVEKFKSALYRIPHTPRILILRLRPLFNIDASGIRALEDILDQAQLSKTQVLLSGLTKEKQLFKSLLKAGIISRVEERHCFPNIQEAVSYAKQSIH